MSMHIARLQGRSLTDLMEIATNPTSAPTTQVAAWTEMAINPDHHLSDPRILELAYKNLGIHETDTSAKAALEGVLQRISNPEAVKIEFIDGAAGGYFLTDEGASEHFAVAKLGEVRAHHETLMRKLALLLKLEKYVVPSFFCSINNLQIDTESGEPDEQIGSAVIKALWNGHRAYYVREECPALLSQTQSQKALSTANTAEKTSKTAIACLQPFVLQPQAQPQSQPQEDDLGLLMLVLAAAARDIKADGIIGHTLIDIEECFTMQNLPNGKPRPARTDLQYLADLEKLNADFLTTNLSEPIITKFKELVQNWDIPTIIDSLKNEKIQFIDEIAENACPIGYSNQSIQEVGETEEVEEVEESEETEEVEEVEESEETEEVEEVEESEETEEVEETEESEESEEFDPATFIVDQGGNRLMIESVDLKNLIDPPHNHLEQRINPNKTLLIEDQLQALEERLTILKDFVLHNHTFSLTDIIFKADPWARAYYETITNAQSLEKNAIQTNQPRPKMPSGYRNFAVARPWSNIGRISPTETPGEFPLMTEVEERFRNILTTSSTSPIQVSPSSNQATNSHSPEGVSPPYWDGVDTEGNQKASSHLKPAPIYPPPPPFNSFRRT